MPGIEANLFTADRTLMPMAGLVTYPILSKSMGDFSYISAYIAGGCAGTFKIVDRIVFLLIAATAGIPVPQLILCPFSSVIMLVVQSGFDNITADSTGLWFGFCRRSTGSMAGNILLVTTGRAFMPMISFIFGPAGLVSMVRRLFLGTDGTHALVDRVIDPCPGNETVGSRRRLSGCL